MFPMIFIKYVGAFLISVCTTGGNMGKRYTTAVQQVDRTKLYTLAEASELIKKVANAKFDETIELSIKLNVNPRKADQNIRSTVILPHGTGKTVRIAVIAKGEKAQEAQKAGADLVGAEDLIEDISKGKLDFDVLIATPDLMKDLAKLGKVLGPRGLMPTPKAGTVTMDMDKVIKEVKSGKIEFKVDEYGILHSGIGKSSFDANKILENAKELINAIKKVKPSTVKGKYFMSVTLTSTMGPGIKIDLLDLM